MGAVMTVVLGGSRNLNHLPDEVLLRLQAWIDAQVDFVVGDAPGIDTVFQVQLKRLGYKRVRVFTSAPDLRSNLGDWPVQRVDSGLKSRGSAMHTAKDRAMTRIADEGLMMWDGVSPGTLANVIDLAEQGKDAYLYVAPEGDLLRFESGHGLAEWGCRYPEPFAEAHKRLRQFAKRQARQRRLDVEPMTLFDDPL